MHLDQSKKAAMALAEGVGIGALSGKRAILLIRVGHNATRNRARAH